MAVALGQGTANAAQCAAFGLVRQLAEVDRSRLLLLRGPLSQGAAEEVSDRLSYPLQQAWVGWHGYCSLSGLSGLPLGPAWSAISRALALLDILHPLPHGLSATSGLLSATLLASTPLLSTTLSWLSATSTPSTPTLSATSGGLSGLSGSLLLLGCGLGRAVFVAGLATVRMSDIDLVFDRWRCGY